MFESVVSGLDRACQQFGESVYSTVMSCLSSLSSLSARSWVFDDVCVGVLVLTGYLVWRVAHSDFIQLPNTASALWSLSALWVAIVLVIGVAQALGSPLLLIQDPKLVMTIAFAQLMISTATYRCSIG
jgi:hypothetical protein